MRSNPLQIWPVMHTDLTEFGLESVEPAEAAKLQKSGWTLVDVRVEENFNFEHAVGSISMPLYRSVQGDSMFDNIKRLVRR
jgi:rhodanese-related sulfurtransferase